MKGLPLGRPAGALSQIVKVRGSRIQERKGCRGRLIPPIWSECRSSQLPSPDRASNPCALVCLVHPASPPGLLPPGVAYVHCWAHSPQNMLIICTPATVEQPPRRYCGPWGWEDSVSRTSPHNQGRECGRGGQVGGNRGLGAGSQQAALISGSQANCWVSSQGSTVSGSLRLPRQVQPLGRVLWPVT